MLKTQMIEDWTNAALYTGAHKFYYPVNVPLLHSIAYSGTLHALPYIMRLYWHHYYTLEFDVNVENHQIMLLWK